MPTLRYLGTVGGPLKRKSDRSLGRSKMKRDRIMQNLLQEDNEDETLHLQQLLKETEKRITTMQGDTPKRPSVAEVIFSACYLLFVYQQYFVNFIL